MTKKSELIQVGELAVGFSENILPDANDLKGKSVKLFFEDDTVTSYHFQDEKILTWESPDVTGSNEGDEEKYRVTCPRENIYFVDYIKQNTSATSVSLVLDFAQGIATSLTGTLPTEEEARMDRMDRVAKGLVETAVETVFMSAALDEEFTAKTPKHEITGDLIGKRVKYVYSRKDTYEHIYLNEDHYTWHCLAGIEKGMADTDLCHYFKIGHELYLFVWREKLVPTLGVVMVDLQAMKTTGKIFGYESNDFVKLTNFPIGAFAQYV